jgi:hypothetical protein
MTYPLLIQGLFSNPQGTISTLNPAALAAPRNWSNEVKIGRGSVVAIDPVLTNTAYNVSDFAGQFTYAIGGTQIFNNTDNARHIVGASPGLYEVLPLVQPGGQTVALSFLNNATVPAGMVVHHYFENKYATAEIIQARIYAAAKQRIQDFRYTVTTVTKLDQSPVQVVPKSLGNVVAVELIVTGASAAATFQQITKALVSLSIGGTSIFENASAGIFTPQSTRARIFPILIRGGETFQFQVDTSEMAATSQLTVTLRMYFDNDLAGVKTYGL